MVVHKLCLVVAAVAFLVLDARAHESPQPVDLSAQLDQLGAIWRRQAEEIVSARITYQSMKVPSRVLTEPNLSYERFHAALEAVDFAANGVADLRAFLDAIGFPRKYGDSPWKASEFVTDGLRRHDRHGAYSQQLFDGELSVRSLAPSAIGGEPDTPNQIDVYPGGSGPYLSSLQSFRITVPPRMSESLAAKRLTAMIVPGLPGLASVSSLSTNQVQRMTFTFDTTTGDVHRQEVEHGGSLMRECLQLAFVQYPDDISFPSVRLHVDYREGHVSLLKMAFIEEAVFNEPIADSQLQVASSRGDILVDRTGPDTPVVHQMPRDVENVIDYLPTLQSEDARAGEVIDNAAARRRMLLWIVGMQVALLVIVIVGFYRLRRNAQRRE